MPTTTKLTALDRCDRCGAQAYVRAEMQSGELLFCAHHARQYRFGLSGAVFVDDQTATL